MDYSDHFEAAMLICFSISWYWSIAKMLRTRIAAGKSAFFVVLIVSGYVFGLAAKLTEWRLTGALNPLVWLYGWNLVVTFTDLLLVLRYSRHPRTRPI